MEPVAPMEAKSKRSPREPKAKREEEVNLVQLRVDVPSAFRARLKAQSARMGITMGELIMQVISEPLKQLEREAVEKDSE
jgi:hypothetical protein